METVRDRALLSEFLTHRVAQEYTIQREKISIFATWQPSWILAENKTLKISRKW